MPLREDCRLRPIAESDLEKVLAWRNSERIRANMFTDHIIALDEHQAWFKRIQQESPVECQIFEFKTSAVGVVNITQIDKINQKCYWGFYLGEVNLPRGTGSAMGYLALEHIFDNLNMHKVCSEIFTFNQESLKFHKRFGFVEEGYFKKHIFKNQQYENIVFMALLKDEWLKIKAGLEQL
ncbi:UDP-4-amino-4,6-dideoxy-N-acetyl-beta-L-altrosamine N-acetyltransferase [Cyanobacteria bacterium FACHB-472]|nr:UDP-4-amino-4,6-dideoxy-N-acetyl-beta-L-altrosamine N-acetyltransferase [Cyanobacteria bacterium FACHB-472]